MSCLLGHLSQIKYQKHHLIWWRNVGSLTFFVCICFAMASKSCYLKSVNHKIVTWNTNRPRRLYFTIFFNLLFLYFPIFSLNCICFQQIISLFSRTIYPYLIRLFWIMSIPTTFRLFRVLTSELIGRRLPVFTLLLWQRQHISLRCGRL